MLKKIEREEETGTGAKKKMRDLLRKAPVKQIGSPQKFVEKPLDNGDGDGAGEASPL